MSKDWDRIGYLIDKGVAEKRLERSLYTTSLASAFRSVRFGITESHGKGIALQFNYLTDEGAIEIRPSMQKALDRLKDLPMDIEPVFPLAK